MTEIERAKEYLLDSRTENQIELGLAKIASKVISDLHIREVFARFIGEIKAYMEIQQFDKKIDSWYIEDLENIYNNNKIIVVFVVYKKEFKMRINIK